MAGCVTSHKCHAKASLSRPAHYGVPIGYLRRHSESKRPRSLVTIHTHTQTASRPRARRPMVTQRVSSSEPTPPQASRPQQHDRSVFSQHVVCGLLRTCGAKSSYTARFHQATHVKQLKVASNHRAEGRGQAVAASVVQLLRDQEHPNPHKERESTSGNHHRPHLLAAASVQKYAEESDEPCLGLAREAALTCARI